jgi:adenylate cyclase
MLAMAQFYRLILRVVVVTSIAILVVQVEELMGRRMFLGFLLGRYERPQAQERIVLSMDLVGSTALAERLGDLRYFRFLNTTYSLMTDALLRNEGEVHKYVGDEVIITWTMEDGLREQNCLDLFFDVQERIAAHAEELEREYGAVPQFRGAVHGGRVIVAQIGHIKRGIELCKELKADLLVSAELLGRIPRAEERFRLGALQVAPVKGRRREVRVHTVERVKRSGQS